VIIRRAEPGDAQALTALANAVSAEPEGWLISTGWRGVADERRFIRAVRRHPDAAVFVAEVNGALVGRLSLARDAHPASGHVADLGLMIDGSYRRQGIGRALMQEAERWAGANGVTKLELHVFPWNEPAIALYESLGYEREGYRKNHYVRDGTYADAVLMALTVSFT
jgi:RimJ/RimL family protein N-acetyltransferase